MGPTPAAKMQMAERRPSAAAIKNPERPDRQKVVRCGRQSNLKYTFAIIRMFNRIDGGCGSIQICVYRIEEPEMPSKTFMCDETYDELVDRLLDIEPDPVSGFYERDAIKIALAEA